MTVYFQLTFQCVTNVMKQPSGELNIFQPINCGLDVLSLSLSLAFAKLRFLILFLLVIVDWHLFICATLMKIYKRCLFCWLSVNSTLACWFHRILQRCSCWKLSDPVSWGSLSVNTSSPPPSPLFDCFCWLWNILNFWFHRKSWLCLHLNMHFLWALANSSGALSGARQIQNRVEQKWSVNVNHW